MFYSRPAFPCRVLPPFLPVAEGGVVFYFPECQVFYPTPSHNELSFFFARVGVRSSGEFRLTISIK